MLNLLRQLWQWWAGELTALLAWINPFSRRGMPPHLRVESNSGSVRYILVKGKNETELGIETVGSQKIKLSRRYSQLPCAVVVDSNDCLIRPLQLPIAAASNLRQAVGYQIDEVTPFQADEVYFGYRQAIEDPDPKDHEINLSIAVASKIVVDDMIGRLREQKIAPFYIGPVPPDRPNAVNLMTPISRSKSIILKTINTCLVVIIIGLFTGFIFAVKSQKVETLDQLQREINEARQRAIEVTELRGNIASVGQLSEQVVNSKRISPKSIALLAEVTRLLPDDTYLLAFRLNNTKLDLIGSSSKAAGLLSRLQRSPLLTDIKFSAPVTMIPKSNRERFRISALVTTDLTGRRK